MADATEISRRQPEGGNSMVVSVLVRPPLMNAEGRFDMRTVSGDIGRAVFGRDHESVAGSYNGVVCMEKVRLGDVAQILEVSAHDARPAPEGDIGRTCDLAVDALHTYVSAMADGNVQALQQFMPPR